MVDAVTNNYSLTQPLVGGDLNTWGTVLNNAMIAVVDAALGSSLSTSITSSDVTLTTTQFQNAIFVLSGTLTGNRSLVVPLSPNSATLACGGRFVVVNNTAGAFSVTVKSAASGSTGVTVPQGFTAILYCDGTNVGYAINGTPAFALASNGPPNGVLAGTAASVNTNASLAFDYVNNALYACTTTGTTSTAGWTALVPPAGSVTQAQLAAGAAPLRYVGAQPNDNLNLVIDASNPNASVTVTAGNVRDDSNATNLQLASTIYKRLDTVWAAGGAATPGNGGCDSGSKGANQTWHGYLIGKLSMAVTQYARTSNVATLTVIGHALGVGGTARIIGAGSGFDGLQIITAIASNTISFANSGVNVSTTTAPTAAICDGFDVVFSQTYNSPTLPSGWTVKQCLGTELTDGSSNLRAITQRGDEFWISTPLLDGVSQSFSGPANVTLNAAGPYAVPLGVSVQVIMNVRNGTGGTFIYIYNPNDADLVASNGAAPLATIGTSVGNITAQAIVWTNTSAQVRVYPSTAPVGYQITVLGWRDPRRRLF